MIYIRLFTAALVFLLVAIPVRAQHAYRAVVLDAHEGGPLAGVNVAVEGTTIGAATDTDGSVIIADIPAGMQTIVFSFVGFEPVFRRLEFPLADPDAVDRVVLEEAHGEMEEVGITATRSSRTIADIPTRVETIAGEEIAEKIAMEPSNISMLLNESPGITVQQTSAVSGGAAIRIQGLDGRYTQMLQDGFPLYGGFSGGLSLLQVPPLDLTQVEVIKGPSSTLYGGGAISGLINLVSRLPADEPALSILANATSAGGYDLGGFYAARGKRLGLTFMGSGNFQRAYDPDDDDFSNLPLTRRLTISPRFFYYPSSLSTVSLGLTGTFEEREGGDLSAIAHGPLGERTFIERNETARLTSRARLDHLVEGKGLITIKNSVSLFDRAIEVQGYRFDGRQVATYTEASLLLAREVHDVVLGVDLRTDAFRENPESADTVRDYTYSSIGSFVQDTWDISERLVTEVGFRLDYHGTFGFFALPKVSLLYRVTENLSTRVGGGLGYKAPTVFQEASEGRAFRGVVPIGNDVEVETSQGGSVDVNYRTLLFDRLAVSVNQAFYFTNLEHPLVPHWAADADQIRYRSADGAIHTRALETNVKFSLEDFKLFLGYVYLDARARYDGMDEPLALTPEHKTYTVLVYEKHGRGRLGLEAYYTGPQRLEDGSHTDGYWITGLMAERRFGAAHLFINFENFLDTKQSNYAPVVFGTRSSPLFTPIWAPMDGFVINGGVKYSL